MYIHRAWLKGVLRGTEPTLPVGVSRECLGHVTSSRPTRNSRLQSHLSILWHIWALMECCLSRTDSETIIGLDGPCGIGVRPTALTLPPGQPLVIPFPSAAFYSHRNPVSISNLNLSYPNCFSGDSLPPSKL